LAHFAFQELPAQPVRTEVGQPTPEPTSAPVAPPAGGSDATGLGPMLPMLLMIAPLFLLMWWMSRSQQKRQEKALSDLKKGDRVLTQSGLVGKLVDLGDRYAKVEVAAGVKLEVLKTSLLGRDTGENLPEKR
jgi:preprotein translocase subunit YajC